MYEAQNAGPVRNNNDSTDHTVVFGHKVCQTRDVKWLCLDKIYQKFHRSNFYDIGGTYVQDVADCWFSYRTEQVCDVFLLHLFVVNHSSTSFSVSVSSSNRFSVDKKNKIVYLSNYLKEFQVKTNSPQSQLSLNYLTTYSFTELDVDTFKNRKLYIAAAFPLSDTRAGEGLSSDVIDSVKLNHDCGDLLLDPIGSDFTIESADGIKFPVHRVILAAHSEVFKAMLKGETAESQNSCVKLVDINEEDLRLMLEFIYTGTVKDIDNANFANLLVLADRYNLKGLLELSQCALVDQLNCENALEILVLADMYDTDFLKHEALKFIKHNTDILNCDTFNEIKNVDLAREMCIYLSQKFDASE